MKCRKPRARSASEDDGQVLTGKRFAALPELTLGFGRPVAGIPPLRHNALQPFRKIDYGVNCWASRIPYVSKCTDAQSAVTMTS
jgi:hypothetical protein